MVHNSTSIFFEPVYKISHSWVDVLIFYIVLFGVVYLARRDFEMDRTKEQDYIFSKARKKYDGDPGNLDKR
jgi:hypothetical protein